MKRWHSTYNVLALLAILCTAIALCLDLSDWYNHVNDLSSENWRFARTVVCGLAFFAAVSYPLNTASKWLLIFALFLAIIADYFLILKSNLVAGIGIFAIMQVVLIARHAIGASFTKFLQPKMAFAAAIGLAILVVGNAFLWPALQAKGLAIPVVIYSSLLVASVLAAYSTSITGVLTIRKANYAFIGMILFLLCDITVGIGAAFGHTSEGELIRSLTGLFYTPSLLLLARSA